VERPAPAAAGDLRLGGSGLLPRQVGGDGDIGLDLRLNLVDTPEASLYHLDRRDLVALQ
jgi:hypothetical protein